MQLKNTPFGVLFDFHELLYDKKNDTVRTIRVNTLFREIAIQAKVLDETKNDNPFLDCHFGSNVGMARFELATSWSQTRRDNRATLHPERNLF